MFLKTVSMLLGLHLHRKLIRSTFLQRKSEPQQTRGRIEFGASGERKLHSLSLLGAGNSTDQFQTAHPEHLEHFKSIAAGPSA